MKRIAITVFTALSLLFSASSFADNPKLTERLRGAVGILYSQDASGGFSMRCTATAFKKIPVGYLFVSAAHCVGKDDTQKERAADGSGVPFYITRDEPGETKTYHRARLTWAGYQSRGEDFAVFEVRSDEHWNIIPLGDESKEQEGSPITNIASPRGLGFQVFHGTISNLNLDRPVIDGRGINWLGALLLDISAGPGSSGSALVSQKNEDIMGFLVGTIGGNNVVGIPVSRFKSVRDAVEADKYSWWAPISNLNPDGTQKEN